MKYLMIVFFVYQRSDMELVDHYENVKEVIRTTKGDDENLYIECENGYAVIVNMRKYKVKIFCA